MNLRNLDWKSFENYPSVLLPIHVFSHQRKNIFSHGGDKAWEKSMLSMANTVLGTLSIYIVPTTSHTCLGSEDTLLKKIDIASALKFVYAVVIK